MLSQYSWYVMFSGSFVFWKLLKTQWTEVYVILFTSWAKWQFCHTESFSFCLLHSCYISCSSVSFSHFRVLAINWNLYLPTKFLNYEVPADRRKAMDRLGLLKEGSIPLSTNCWKSISWTVGLTRLICSSLLLLMWECFEDSQMLVGSKVFPCHRHIISYNDCRYEAGR